MPFRDAGPLQEPTLCSQIEQVTRFAETDTPEPELVPRGHALGVVRVAGLAAPCGVCWLFIRHVALRLSRVRCPPGRLRGSRDGVDDRTSSSSFAISGESYFGASIA